MKYDTRGNITSKTDGNGNTTTYAYDGENNLTSVKDALGNITAYTYDNNGNVLTQKDGNGNVTTYTYNAANKMTAKIDPASGGIPGLSETYTYYANGLMASKTDRNSVTTGYTYDIFGRLTEENAGGEKQSYTYDGNGNTLTMTDASGTTTRTYDALNRNTKKTVPGIGTSTYDYDLSTGTAGEYMEQTTDPKGNITKKTYDNMGRLSKVTAGNETTGYEYYRNGRQYRVTYPNQTTETYLYDADNQITKLVNAKSDGSVLSSYDYTYDAAGNQTSKTDAKGKTSYSYDRLNRLSTVTEPITVNNTSASKLTSYTYDGAGNRKSEKIQIGDSYTTTLYSYNALNRLTSTLSSNGDETHYTYDNNGNLLSKTTGSSAMKTLANDSQTETISTKDELPSFNLVVRRSSENGTGTKSLAQYRYDKYNRLITMKDEDTTASYTYNAQGYRVEKTINGTTTDYLYEGDKVVLETDKSNNQKAVQVYGNSLLSRSVAGSSGTGAEKYFYLYNAHGDVTSLINPAGGVAASYDYDAFGNIINKTGDANNSTLYAGYQHDDESGLYYLNARYYDSVTARFITEDTYTGQANDPLSLNLYTYCSNNPIIYTDPSGHSVKSVTGSFANGFWTSLKDTGKGLVNAVKHPFKTALSVAEAIANPVNTVKSTYKVVKKTVNNKLIKGSAEDRAYVGGYLVSEAGQALVTAGVGKALKAAKGAKAAKIAAKADKTEKAIDKASDVAKGADKVNDAAKVEIKVGKTAKGASKNTLDLMKDVDVINGKYYTSKSVIDEIGKAEAKGVDFSSFKKTIQSTRPSTEGGVSQVIRYSDKNGTSFIVHQVTDSTGKILHRDYDAVRIGSGQLINKK